MAHADWKPIDTAPMNTLVFVAFRTPKNTASIHKIRWHYGIARKGGAMDDPEWDLILPDFDDDYYPDPEWWDELPNDPPDKVSDAIRNELTPRGISLLGCLLGYGYFPEEATAISRAYDAHGKIGPAVVKAYELLDDENDTKHDYAGEVAIEIIKWEKENRYDDREVK